MVGTLRFAHPTNPTFPPPSIPRRKALLGMKTYKIAAIPGDGIGKEVIAAGIEVLGALAARDGGFAFRFDHFDWGSDYYKRHGVMMPADGGDRSRHHDAIYFGAVGAPDVPDHVTLWGLRLAICQRFDQYANVRPTRILPGITSPLRHVSGHELDWVIVRENSEGEYAGNGGRVHRGLPEEVGTEVAVFTRAGVSRIMRFDAMTVRRTLKPSSLDTIVATNLHADILSDLAAALAGSIGIAPTANLNPEHKFPSMFEPIPGSAFAITGKGIANPIGTFWSATMMLEHLGRKPAADRLMR